MCLVLVLVFYVDISTFKNQSLQNYSCRGNYTLSLPLCILDPLRSRNVRGVEESSHSTLALNNKKEIHVNISFSCNLLFRSFPVINVIGVERFDFYSKHCSSLFFLRIESLLKISHHSFVILRQSA